MPQHFEAFLAQRRGDLRRIAGRTGGEHGIDDLASESWLLAIEIGQKRGWLFDFRSQDDQDTLLAWLYARFVRYAEKAVRFAVKLDRNWDNEDGERAGEALARLLTAPVDSDPQIRQQALEAPDEFLGVVRLSYSQAAAYVLLLVRVDWDFAELAGCLWVTAATLRDRVKAAGLLARIQPSLWDGVEEISADFEPWRKARAMARRFPIDSPQLMLGLSPLAA
jgi:hypothetical protein